MGMFDTCSGDDCQYRRDIDTLRSEVARLTAERDAAVATAHQSDAVARALGADFTRVLRDCCAAEAERDALTAEVEAMRGVVNAARRVVDCESDQDVKIWSLGKAIAALDALRTRKVGE